MKIVLQILLCTMGIYHAISAPDCDFDNDVCDWINTDWTLSKTISSSSLNGPSTLYDGGYIYLNTPDVAVATLSSETFSLNGVSCFLFRYHMKSKSVSNTVGNLSIVVTDNFNRRVHELFGHQGSDWRCGRINLSGFGSQIWLKVTGYRLREETLSVIALDALHFLSVDETRCQDDMHLSSQECDAMYDVSTDTTSSITDSSVASTSPPGVTMSTTPDFLIYVITIPSGVLVLSIILIVVCIGCKRKSKSDNTYVGQLSHLESYQDHGRKPSESPSQRYPSMQLGHAEEEYDEIKDDQYDYIMEKREYEQGNTNPTSTQSTDNTILPAITKPEAPLDAGYIILPAITKPQTSHDDYLQPVSMRQGPRGKISISEQGATYTDLSNYRSNEGHGFENADTPDYLECL